MRQLGSSQVPAELQSCNGHLVVLVSGEGHVELCDHAAPLRLLQLLLVQVVLHPVSAAIVHHRLSNLLP